MEDVKICRLGSEVFHGVGVVEFGSVVVTQARLLHGSPCVIVLPELHGRV